MRVVIRSRGYNNDGPYEVTFGQDTYKGTQDVELSVDTKQAQEIVNAIVQQDEAKTVLEKWYRAGQLQNAIVEAANAESTAAGVA